jgi:NADH:ubiquinone oxidoreductase subunit E
MIRCIILRNAFPPASVSGSFFVWLNFPENCPIFVSYRTKTPYFVKKITILDAVKNRIYNTLTIHFPMEIPSKERINMPNKKTLVAFSGTPEQEAQLRDVISQYKDVQGGTMPVMQAAQNIYGYLPIEVQQMIADGLNIPLSEVYGIATFYSLFTLNPKGQHRVSVCLGTACYVKNSQLILDKIEAMLGCKSGSITPDGKFSVDATRCVGACGLAPVMMVDDDVYGRLTPDMVGDILKKYM